VRVRERAVLAFLGRLVQDNLIKNCTETRAYHGVASLSDSITPEIVFFLSVISTPFQSLVMEIHTSPTTKVLVKVSMDFLLKNSL
jgi:hypothetical protein